MILDNEYLIDARVPNEARYLVQNGYEVYVLCLNFDQRPHFETVDGVHIVRFSLSRRWKNILFGTVNTFPLYDWIWKRQISRFIDRYQITALHAHDLYMIKAAHMANRKRHLPITVDLHENYPEAVKGYTWANRIPRKWLARPEIWKKKEHRYLSYADHIIVLIESFRQTICSEYPDLAVKNFVEYPNVPDTDRFLSLPVDASVIQRQQAFFTLLYFGVIGVRRGMELCFEALKILIPQIPEIRLMLIGPVDKADQPLFLQYMNDAMLKEYIDYYPWIDIKELPSFLLASDVCVSAAIQSPQHDSGIGNKIFQYMLFERPIVVTNSKPILKLVEETSCGFTFEDLNAEDMAEKIMTLYRQPSLRKTMGQNGKNAVMKKYNLQNAGKNLEKLYRFISEQP
jgi:glycosyltransferase involved in cell wall biosynthesis